MMRSALLGLVLVAAAMASPVVPAQEEAMMGNLMEEAEKLHLHILLKAVRYAGLYDTLATGGPFTLFAPSDKAFMELPSGIVKELMANKTLLTEVLKYHVLAGKVMSTSLSNDLLAPTLNGAKIRVNIYKDGKVITISGSQVTMADKMASNGVIHIIDHVMLPPVGSVVDAVKMDPMLSTLLTAVTTADLGAVLSGAGPFTVFAPTNEAFNKLPAGTLAKLLKDKAALTNILKYHVVSGTFYSKGLSDGQVMTLNGQTVTVKTSKAISAEGVMINNANVQSADITVTNGVVHIIDTVLLPLSDGENMKNLMQEAERLQLNFLVMLIKKVGLYDTLATKGPFTMFAPTNEAFMAIPPMVRHMLMRNATLLTEMLKYHVVAGKVMSTSLSNELLAPTLNGAKIRVNIYKDGKVITISGSQVTMADKMASNGVIHVIDHVMHPPVGSVVDAVKMDPMLSTLLTAVTTADLGAVLSGPGPFTVFAPTNKAFAKLPAGTLDKLLKDKAALTNILKYHVVSGTVYSKGLSDGGVMTLNGKNVIVKVSQEGVMINDGNVEMADITVTNGVVHIIDTVLLPPSDEENMKNLMEEADMLGLSTLVSLVKKAGLFSTLATKGPFTIFAPSNDAFMAIPPMIRNMLMANKTLLTEVLKYHIVAGKVMSTSLSNELLTPTLNGAKIRVNIYKDGKVITISGSQVTMADKMASNGIIHIIDHVMLPPVGSVVDAVKMDPMLSTLLTAVTTADLGAVLSGPGPFTVFAPTNRAFAKLPAGTLDKLLKDKAALTNILKYHVVSGTVYSKGLSDGGVMTLNGKNVMVKVSQEGVMINDANVEMANITVTNGVVHIIDTVLLPPSDEGNMKNLMEKADMLGLSTLVSLVKKDGLFSTLATKGPFTIFAPSNDAFMAIPPMIRNMLMANKTLLTEVLKYHVVAGKVMSTSLSNELLAPSLNGAKIRVNIYQGGKVITATGSQVTMADKMATNGVIHVLDSVMFPIPMESVVGFIKMDPHLSTLLKAVEAADLAGVLSGPGPFTVFAPTNMAFSELPEGELEKLLKDKTALTNILKYHVVSGTFYSKGLMATQMVPTLNTDTVKITKTTGGVMVNKAKVRTADIPVTNGVVHVIEGVLTPKMEQKELNHGKHNEINRL